MTTMSNMNYFKFFISIVLFGSCSKPEENFIRIPSIFSVSIQEEIRPASNKAIWLELSSMNSQYCQEDTLAYTTTPGANSILIAIQDSYKANDCYQNNYFLKTRIRLPYFSDSLQLQINFGSASTINCCVYNTTSYYNIEIYKGLGLIAKPDTTYKIPNNLVWGYAYPKTTSSDGIVNMNRFKQDLEYNLYLKFLRTGYYSYFSILDNNVLLLKENPGIVGNNLNFYFIHDKTEEELNKLFVKLASDYVGLVGYKINTGCGKEFILN